MTQRAQRPESDDGWDEVHDLSAQIQELQSEPAPFSVVMDALDFFGAGDVVRSVASRANTRDDAAVLSVLGSISAATAGTVDVRDLGSSWTPTSLFTLFSSPPVSRKSRMAKTAFAPHVDLDNEIHEKHMDRLKEYKSLPAKDKKIVDPPSRSSPGLIMPGNGTIEGMALYIGRIRSDAAIENSEAVTLFSGWSWTGSRAVRSASDMSLLWDGTAQRLKAGDGGVVEMIRNARCTITAALQPEPFRELISMKEMRNGLASRILMVEVIDQYIDHKYERPPGLNTEEVLNSYADTIRLMRKVADRRALTQSGESSPLRKANESVRAYMDDDAREHLSSYQEEAVRKHRYEDYGVQYAPEIYGRSAEQALRIAACLKYYQVCASGDWNWDGGEGEEDIPKPKRLELGLDDIVQGISIALWFADESIRLIGEFGDTDSEDRKIANKWSQTIKKHAQEERLYKINKSQLKRWTIPGPVKQDTEAQDRLLEILCDANMLRRLQKSPGSKAIEYEINPSWRDSD